MNHLNYAKFVQFRYFALFWNEGNSNVTEVETGSQSWHFLTDVQIRDGWEKHLSQFHQFSLGQNLWYKYIWRGAARASERLESACSKSTAAKQKTFLEYVWQNNKQYDDVTVKWWPFCDIIIDAELIDLFTVENIDRHRKTDYLYYITLQQTQ